MNKEGFIKNESKDLEDIGGVDTTKLEEKEWFDNLEWSEKISEDSLVMIEKVRKMNEGLKLGEKRWRLITAKELKEGIKKGKINIETQKWPESHPCWWVDRAPGLPGMVDVGDGFRDVELRMERGLLEYYNPDATAKAWAHTYAVR
ncbi:MAG: hypothetical protein WCP89_01700 [archaeon]